jgi:hypothetical protein
MVDLSKYMDDPIRRRIESRNLSLSIARRNLDAVMQELEFLINATPTGDRRNILTGVNIYLISAKSDLNRLKGETIK